MVRRSPTSPATKASPAPTALFVSTRGASIRIPHSFVNNSYRGYLEDRRPNSLGDPYRIAGRILQTIETVPTETAESLAEEPERAVA